MTTDFLERIEAGEGTAQDAAQALHAAMTGQSVDADTTSDAADANTESTTPTAGADTIGSMPELSADNAVIESRNGKYTIPFEQLEKSRQMTAQAQARVAELEAQLRSAHERQESGQAPTQADTNAQAAAVAIERGVDPALFGDFSEEALANGIAKFSMQQIALVRKELRAELLAELAPIRKERQQAASDGHTGAIYSAHEDADSIVESQEFTSWVNSKPSFARAAYLRVLDPETGGTTQEVIELFDTFKKETGIATQRADASLAARAKAAVAGATAQIPSSLSDIPGGRLGATNHLDAIDSMTPAQQMAAVSALSPEQRAEYMNRTA